MSEINLRRQHSKTPAEARAAAEQMAARLQAKFGLDCAWEGEILRFKHPGLSGTLDLANAEAALNIQLGGLFSAFKPAIEREVNKFFDSSFAA
jgi:putative polyhydroxyalkanoate system protein